MSEEQKRIEEQRSGAKNWWRWGPYLAERQWGTVREDYSPDGSAWTYFPHDHARSRAYRWGEDGLAGLCDEHGRLCLALALWNEADPILKERLFGLSNPQGNHGEDVKELYYYLDAVPSHAYLKYLYKYPQRAFPYDRLVDENRRRSRHEREFELLDTGIFDEDRYFDVQVEYAKATPNDILMRVTATNRGPDPAPLHILPHLWFRNTWTWTEGTARPVITRQDDGLIVADHPTLKSFRWAAEPGAESLFTNNRTNHPRLYGIDRPGPFKDAFHDAVVGGDRTALAPDPSGTKAALHYRFIVPPGGSCTVRTRLSRLELPEPLVGFDEVVEKRRGEADAFYDELQRGIDDPDRRLVHRQALAGTLWTKQFYYFDVTEWLRGDPTQPPPPEPRRHGRNADWVHFNSADVLSVPDKWEYPWFAAWDTAFNCVALATVDPDFAKEQLLLLTRVWYLHPNGELPAYEWNFSDVNPPVHAWATWRVFEIDRKARGDEVGDLHFLKRVFHKLCLNFTWWVNRKDARGRNIFQGGFLGLDNIGVFDRNSRLPNGATVNQADGTAWMAMYCLNLMRIAIELGQHDDAYQDLATKFFEHFLYIAAAMTAKADGGMGLWDETDGFYYDAMQLPDGSSKPLKLRSMVGLIPLFAVEVLDPDLLDRVPGFAGRLEWFLEHRPELSNLVSRWEVKGRGNAHLLSLLRGHRMKRLLKRMLDPGEFLSDHGVRAMSKAHEREPYVFRHDGCDLTVRYLPGDSDSDMFGGNSNWRGPIWMPVNFLVVESIRRFHAYYGDEFQVECPVGSGRMATLAEVADELACRLERLFLRDPATDRRPALGESEKEQHDPHFRDLPLFYEYFDGDNGRGLGASHQTGWTALIAVLLQPRTGQAPDPTRNCPNTGK